MSLENSIIFAILLDLPSSGEGITSPVKVIRLWWSGGLNPDSVVYGLRWALWMKVGKILQGLCLVLTGADIIGEDRLRRFSHWLQKKTEATNLMRFVAWWSIVRKMRQYHDANFAGLGTERALKAMESSAAYMSLNHEADSVFDSIKWRSLVPWFLCLILFLCFASTSPILFLVAIVIINVPLFWPLFGILLLRLCIPFAVLIRQQAVFRLAYLLGAATWLFDVVWYSID